MGCAWPHTPRPRQPVPGAQWGRWGSQAARTRRCVTTGFTPGCAFNRRGRGQSLPWSQPPACTRHQWPTVPPNLLGQLFGPVARLPGGVLTGHVAGRQQASTELSGVLGGVAGLVHDGPDVGQHFRVCRRPDRRAGATRELPADPSPAPRPRKLVRRVPSPPFQLHMLRGRSVSQHAQEDVNLGVPDPKPMFFPQGHDGNRQ